MYCLNALFNIIFSLFLSIIQIKIDLKDWFNTTCNFAKYARLIDYVNERNNFYTYITFCAPACTLEFAKK